MNDNMDRKPGESARQWRDRLVEDRAQLLSMVVSVNSPAGQDALDRTLAEYRKRILHAELLMVGE